MTRSWPLVPPVNVATLLLATLIVLPETGRLANPIWSFASRPEMVSVSLAKFPPAVTTALGSNNTGAAPPTKETPTEVAACAHIFFGEFAMKPPVSSGPKGTAALPWREVRSNALGRSPKRHVAGLGCVWFEFEAALLDG